MPDIRTLIRDTAPALPDEIVEQIAGLFPEEQPPLDVWKTTREALEYLGYAETIYELVRLFLEED